METVENQSRILIKARKNYRVIFYSMVDSQGFIIPMILQEILLVPSFKNLMKIKELLSKDWSWHTVWTRFFRSWNLEYPSWPVDRTRKTIPLDRFDKLSILLKI